MTEPEKAREPDVIEPGPAPEVDLDDDAQVKETCARPTVPATGRTVGNLLREGRQIT